MMAWHAALVQRVPASRDYADWVLPFIREQELREPAYSRFWMREVSAKNMPRNHITAMAEFFQLRRRIDPGGNAADALHANHLLDTDVFVTADKDFYEILRLIADRYQVRARPDFVHRGAPSALEELQRILS